MAFNARKSLASPALANRARNAFGSSEGSALSAKATFNNWVRFCCRVQALRNAASDVVEASPAAPAAAKASAVFWLSGPPSAA